MSREVRRVPLGFDHPLKQVWPGYLSPEKFNAKSCPDCSGGYAPHAQYLHNLWYGHVPFDPASTGSTPLTPRTPAVRAFAERNVERAPDYYGTSEWAIHREAARLAALWNGQWRHHLSQDDVDALVAGGRLMDFTHTWSRETRWQPKDPPYVPTAAEVNEWAIGSFGHDSINAMIAVRARCERDGFEVECPTCNGYGSLEAYPGQRAEAEAWQPSEPPTGEGWQLWETVSEGSPVSPVFPDADLLALWLTTEKAGLARCSTMEVARRFVAAGWAPTGFSSDATGYVDGPEFIGRTAAAEPADA